MIDAGVAIALMTTQATIQPANRPGPMTQRAPHGASVYPTVPLDIPAEDQLEQLLQYRRQYPQWIDDIDAEIQERFLKTHAILILDMAGLTTTTQNQGIIPALEAIFHLRDRVIPLLADHGGRLLKAEADNVYGVFDDPRSALMAARDIIYQLQQEDLTASIGIGYGAVLTVGERDLYGDQMNLTSRLGEDLAGENEILLTASAHAALEPYPWQFQPREVVTHGSRVVFYQLVQP